MQGGGVWGRDHRQISKLKISGGATINSLIPIIPSKNKLFHGPHYSYVLVFAYHHLESH